MRKCKRPLLGASDLAAAFPSSGTLTFWEWDLKQVLDLPLLRDDLRRMQSLAGSILIQISSHLWAATVWSRLVFVRTARLAARGAAILGFPSVVSAMEML